MIRIIKIHSPKTEVITLVSTQKIESILSEQLGIKKDEYNSRFWDEIINRCKMAIANHFTESVLKDLMGQELTDFVKEGP